MHAWGPLLSRRRPCSPSFEEMNAWNLIYSDRPLLALSPPVLITSFSTTKKALFWITAERPIAHLSLSAEVWISIWWQTRRVGFVERRLLHQLTPSDFFPFLIREKETEKEARPYLIMDFTVCSSISYALQLMRVGRSQSYAGNSGRDKNKPECCSPSDERTVLLMSAHSTFVQLESIHGITRGYHQRVEHQLLQ